MNEYDHDIYNLPRHILNWNLSRITPPLPALTPKQRKRMNHLEVLNYERTRNAHLQARAAANRRVSG